MVMEETLSSLPKKSNEFPFVDGFLLKIILLDFRF